MKTLVSVKKFGWPELIAGLCKPYFVFLKE